MTPQDPEEPSSLPDQDEIPGGEILAGSPDPLTLEMIVSRTGEMEHLNELVMLHLEDEGGFRGTEAYFSIVRPVLDQLEGEIRARYLPGMTRAAMKQAISDWIENEICLLQ